MVAVKRTQRNRTHPRRELSAFSLCVLSAGIASCGGEPTGVTPPPPPPPPPPPSAPAPVGSIPAQVVGVGETVALDVSAYFTDADGDALAYAASSSVAGVVSVSVSGATVSIAGVAKGTADVTVTARDPAGLTATQTFAVTVPNQGPEPAGSIPDQTIQVGETAALDVSVYFTDADGDALAYGASSSAAGVVSVSMSGATVSIAGVAKGTADVTVTASDPAGLTATQTFAVTVPNRRPEPAGSIPDQTIQVGETAALDVSLYFTDADGDALAYAAASSDTSVAAVSVSGAEVRIQGVAVGRTTLTVTAHDADGDSAIQRAGVDVTIGAPDLAFTDLSPASATLTPGDAVTFTFRVRNQGTVASGATTIRAMRSVNPTVSPRDTELESYSLSSLAPSLDRPFPLTITVDANSAPGTIYIGMCVDAVQGELNTRNNCSEGARLTIVTSSSAWAVDSGLSIQIRASRPRE